MGEDSFEMGVRILDNSVRYMLCFCQRASAFSFGKEEKWRTNKIDKTEEQLLLLLFIYYGFCNVLLFSWIFTEFRT